MRGTTFRVRDNGGVRTVRGIRGTPAGGVTRGVASLTRVTPNRKLRRGDLAPVVVVGTRRWTTRRGGCSVRLGYNGATPVKKDGSPAATKLYSPVVLEARPAGYARLVQVARGVL